MAGGTFLLCLRLYIYTLSHYNGQLDCVKRSTITRPFFIRVIVITVSWVCSGIQVVLAVPDGETTPRCILSLCRCRSLFVDHYYIASLQATPIRPDMKYLTLVSRHYGQLYSLFLYYLFIPISCGKLLILHLNRFNLFFCLLPVISFISLFEKYIYIFTLILLLIIGISHVRHPHFSDYNAKRSSGCSFLMVCVDTLFC